MKTRESSPHRKAVRRISVIVEDPKESAISAGLRYVSDQSPGITRKRTRANFAYYDTEGKRIGDASELKRIRSLVIPPAWENVWICPQANGHLQATGIDAKGRKQYKYHPTWRAVRDEAKFEKLLSFAEALAEDPGAGRPGYATAGSQPGKGLGNGSQTLGGVSHSHRQ